MPEVCLARCENYEPGELKRALGKVLAPLGGLSFVRPGMKIVIKANLVASKDPDAAVTTHPALLAALTEMLTARGAEVTIGDSPGGLFNSVFVNRIYHGAGLGEAEKAGARLNQNFNERTAEFPEGFVLKEFPYTAYLDDADVIINFAKLKTHGMMALSAAVKNMFGIVPGTVKPEFHCRFPRVMDFARMLLDLNRRFPAYLNLIDGVVGMEGNGPTSGTPRKIGVLLASRDPFKLDLVAARLIGLKKDDVPTLEAAFREGLIPAAAEEVSVNLPLDDLIVPDFKHISNEKELWTQDGNAALWGKSLSRLMDRFLASRPILSPSDCVGCRECQKVCPVHAITMKDNKPKINRSLCIRCFCCQEFCPKGALHVRRPALAKLLNHK